jgi:chaperone required for assembly of F1-ATPase
MTTLTGSALLALAVLRGRLSAEDAWRAAHVDEDWNFEQWGRDALAMERRAFRLAEMQAAATLLAALGEDRSPDEATRSGA